MNESDLSTFLPVRNLFYLVLWKVKCQCWEINEINIQHQVAFLVYERFTVIWRNEIQEIILTQDAKKPFFKLFLDYFMKLLIFFCKIFMHCYNFRISIFSYYNITLYVPITLLQNVIILWKAKTLIKFIKFFTNCS